MAIKGSSLTILKVARDDLSCGYAKSDRNQPPAPAPTKGGIEPTGVPAVYGTRGDPAILGASSLHPTRDDARINAEQRETSAQFITPKKAFRTRSFGSESDKAFVVQDQNRWTRHDESGRIGSGPAFPLQPAQWTDDHTQSRNKGSVSPLAVADAPKIGKVTTGFIRSLEGLTDRHGFENKMAGKDPLEAAEELLHKHLATLDALKQRQNHPTKTEKRSTVTARVWYTSVMRNPTRLVPCSHSLTGSSVRQAMSGDGHGHAPHNKPSDAEDPGSGQEQRSNDYSTRKQLRDPPGSHLSSSSDDSDSDSQGGESDSSFGSDFLNEESAVVSTADSANAKSRKREEKRKYQQSFLKGNPPLSYKGQGQVAFF